MTPETALGRSLAIVLTVRSSATRKTMMFLLDER
jgi:hypothetical protein